MPKTVMIPLYVPEDWHPDIKKLADDNGMSIVEYVRGLIRESATKEMRKRWSEPAKRGNPAFQNQGKRKKRSPDR